MLLRIVAVLILPMLITGCGSAFNSVVNAPNLENKIKDEEDKVIAGTLSLSADRRVVLVSTWEPTKGKFCAEPPPDVAKAQNSELKATLEATLKEANTNLDAGGKAELEEKITQVVTKLFEKSQSSDIFRTGTYVICQYYLIQAINGGDVRAMFKDLLESVTQKAEK